MSDTFDGQIDIIVHAETTVAASAWNHRFRRVFGGTVMRALGFFALLLFGCEAREERLRQAEEDALPWETVVPDTGAYAVYTRRLKVPCGWLYHVRYTNGSAVFVPDGSCACADSPPSLAVSVIH